MLKRRSAIEPTIGHLKSDHRLERNFLRGKSGDSINCPDECGWLQLLQTVEGFCLPHVFQPQVVPENLCETDLEECKQDWGFPQVAIANANQDGMTPSQRKFGWEGYARMTRARATKGIPRLEQISPYFLYYQAFPILFG